MAKGFPNQAVLEGTLEAVLGKLEHVRCTPGTVAPQNCSGLDIATRAAKPPAIEITSLERDRINAGLSTGDPAQQLIRSGNNHNVLLPVRGSTFRPHAKTFSNVNPWPSSGPDTTHSPDLDDLKHENLKRHFEKRTLSGEVSDEALTELARLRDSRPLAVLVKKKYILFSEVFQKHFGNNKQTSPTNDQPEPTCIIAQPAAHVLVDLTTQPESSYNGDLATSSLQFHKTSFQIRDESLQTLQPGEWLNDEIVIGAPRLIKEVSKDKVVVIDSFALQGQERCPRVDFRNAKILLPMLIRGNHWVLGVYDDDTRLLVYDSLPSQTTNKDISDQTRKFFSEILGKDDIDNLRITITSPLIQVNSHDCGVLVIIAAFHEAMDLRIKPTDVDPCFWREILHRLLRSQSRFEEAPVDTRSAKLPQPPTKAELSEHSEAVNMLHNLISSFRQQTEENNRKIASAKLVLEITGRAREGATKAGLENSVTRFQQVENYCKTEVKRLLSERRIMGQLIGPSITNFRNGTVETQQINKPSDMGRSSGKLNGDQDNRKRKRNGLSVDEPSHSERRREQSLTSSISPNNHDDPESHPPIKGGAMS
ncbi:hypothetical protein V8F33_006902 [Rhypophila sp. PSN 637]